MSIVAAPQKEKTYAKLLMLIKSMSPGTPLPSIRELMSEFSIGQATLVSAYNDLEARGFIERRPRKGVFVANSKLASAMLNMDDGIIDKIVSHENDKIVSLSSNYRKSSLELVNIALVLPHYFLDISGQHPAASIALSGINSALNYQKYSISTLFYRPNKIWKDCGKLAVERDISGLLLWPDSTVCTEDMQRLLDAEIKIVLTQNEKRFAELGLININIDTSMALAQILKRFNKLGHKNISVALYTSKPMRRRDMDIIENFCHSTGNSVNDMVIDIPNSNAIVDYSGLEALLARERQPTAIVLEDEYAAAAMFRLCYERNIRVPEQISIASLVDNTPHTHPIALTAPDSVSLGIKEAQLGAEYLEKLLVGENPSEREIHLGCNVEWKASIGPAPKT